MATYKTTTSKTATLGEKSSAVLELQKKLNALGAGLKLDSMYGPLTQAAATKYATQLETPEVPAPVVQEKFSYTLSPEEKALQDALAESAGYLKKKSSSVINEKQIMADTLAQFQGEINATNSIYADKLKRAQVEGVGRIGTSAAVNARRGLAGSDFGNAMTDNVVGANQDIYNSIENERLLASSTLMGKAKEAGLKAIQDKRTAKEAGLTEYMTHLTSAGTASKNRATEVAKTILASKFKYEDYDTTTLEEAAKSAGVSLASIKSSYDELKAVQEKKDAELEELRLKNTPKGFELSPEQRRFEYDEETGEYKLVASGADKKFASGSGGGSGNGGGSGGSGSGGGTYKSDLDALIANSYNLIASKNGKEAFAASIKGARNEADKINSIATIVLKNSPADVRVDFTNQNAGIRNIDKAIAMLDTKAKTGVINDKLQYTFNVFGKDYDPKLAAIQAYITSAIQPYRNSITGAAWGEQEESEYQSLFASTKFSPKELRERLVRIKEIMADKSVNALQSQINPMGGYEPFIGGGKESVIVVEDGVEIEIVD